MENETFRSRLAKLMQKSRKALRLYSSMGRLTSGKNIEFTEMQVQEWKAVNGELLRKLSEVGGYPDGKRLTAEVFALRDRFYNEWRMAQGDLHSAHKELIFASENGDFVKAANLSRTLVGLKARVQATQAAQHELQEVLDQSRVTQPAIELRQSETEQFNFSQPQAAYNPPKGLAQESKNESAAASTGAKIIPLRRTQGR